MLTIEVLEKSGFRATDGSELWWSSHELHKFAIFHREPGNCRYAPLTSKEQVPTHIEAHDTQHSNAANRFKTYLQLDSLQFLRLARGAYRKRKGNRDGWTIESHKYSVYLYQPTYYSHPEVVIAEIHGGGATFYWIHDLIFDETLQEVLPHMSDNALFDFLRVFCRGYTTGLLGGYQEAKSELTHAFVEGRLKKRKLPKQGVVKIWIEPKVKDNAASIDIGESGELAVT